MELSYDLGKSRKYLGGRAIKNCPLIALDVYLKQYIRASVVLVVSLDKGG